MKGTLRYMQCVIQRQVVKPTSCAMCVVVIMHVHVCVSLCGVCVLSDIG